MLHVGQKCLGHKHEDVIKSQQKAIATLRHKLNDVEFAHPPGLYLYRPIVKYLLTIFMFLICTIVGSHQVTLSELSKVRKELLQLKSEKLATNGNAQNHERKESSKTEVELLRIHKVHDASVHQFEV